MHETIWQGLNFVFSFGVITLLFAMIFKVLQQKEPTMVEGKDASHAGGRDRRIHGTAGGAKEFRSPCLGRVPGGRVDVHRSYGGRIQR